MSVSKIKIGITFKPDERAAFKPRLSSNLKSLLNQKTEKFSFI